MANESVIRFGEEEEREWNKRIKAFADEEAKKLEYEEMMEALKAIGDAQALKSRAATLKSAAEALEKEEIAPPAEAAEKIRSLEERSKSIAAKIPALSEKAFDKLELRQLIYFIGRSDPFKDDKDNEFKYLIRSLSDERKQKIHALLRSEPISDAHDIQMVRKFEESIGYAVDFALKAALQKLDPKLEPFYGLLSTYIKSYDRRIKATVEWLANEAWHFDLDEAYLLELSKTVVRRLSVGSELENAKHREAYVKRVSEEFAEVINEHLPKSPRNKLRRAQKA